jgi:hypothetical protein
MSLYRNSPVRFHAMGSVDMLHLTTPGVVKKNDHVMKKVPTPINEPSADRTGINAPATSNAAVVKLDNAKKISFTPDPEYGQPRNKRAVGDIQSDALCRLRREFLYAE